MVNLKQYAFLFGMALLILVSCKKEELTFKELKVPLNPDVGVPLVSATIRAEKAIESLDENDLLQIGESGQISLIYSDTVRELNLSEFFDIPDQTFTETNVLSADEEEELFQNGTVTVSNSQIETFTLPEGDELDSLRIQSVGVNVRVETDGNIPFSGFVRLLNADGSVALEQNFEGAAPPLILDVSEFYEDLFFLFSNSPENSNTFGFEYEVTYEYNNSQSFDAQPINIELELNDLAVHTIGGYLAPRSFLFDSLNVEIDEFERDFEGSFVISDPRLRVDVDNGYGLGVSLNILDVEAQNKEGQPFTIEGDNITQLPVVQPAPSLGQSTVTSVMIDNSRSNPTITQLISFEPTVIETGILADLNPQGESNVFASILNDLDITFQVEVPIFGSVSDFLLEDTANTDLGDFIEEVNRNDELQSLQFNYFVDNGLPLDLGCQIIFTDSLFNRIDSLFLDETYLIESAPVDYAVPPHSPEYGRAVGKTPTLLEILIERDRIPPLEEVTFIIFRVFGNTTDNGAEPIRIFSQDELDFDFSVKASLKIE